MDDQQRALRDEVDELRARLSAIESELTRHAGAAEPTPLPPSESMSELGPPAKRTPEPDITRTTDRRSALKLAGAAAAGLAGGAVLSSTTPAAAASGDALLLGSTTNTSSSGTQLTTVGNSTVAGLDVLTTNSTPVAIHGRAPGDGSIGVHGSAGQGTGVIGEGQFEGVYGKALGPSGIGVRGLSAGGWAVRATTETGTAVSSEATGANAIGLDITSFGVGIRFPNWGNGPNIRFSNAPASVTAAPGDLRMRSDGLWYCYEGTDATAKWFKISGGLVTLPVPIRVYDSRGGQPPVGIGPKARLEAGVPRAIDCKGNGSGVPAGVASVLLNLVVTNTVSSGYLGVFKASVPYPNTSNLNWAQGQTIAVTTVSAVDAQSQLGIWASSATDVVVDVIGYYP